MYSHHFHPYHHRHFRSRFDHMRRPGGGAGGGRRGKLFDSAQFQLLVLALIGDEQRHGYELMREIEARTGSAYVPSPGVVYPTLTLLTELGLIEEADAAGARKAYRLTAAGRERLAEAAEEAGAVLARLDALGDNASRADAAPVRRAMGNLRQVLQTRLARQDTTDEQLLDAARIIDEAAGAIERLK